MCIKGEKEEAFDQVLGQWLNMLVISVSMGWILERL